MQVRQCALQRGRTARGPSPRLPSRMYLGCCKRESCFPCTSLPFISVRVMLPRRKLTREL